MRKMGKKKKRKRERRRGEGEMEEVGRERAVGWLVGWLRKWNSVTVNASVLH